MAQILKLTIQIGHDQPKKQEEQSISVVVTEAPGLTTQTQLVEDTYKYICRNFSLTTGMIHMGKQDWIWTPGKLLTHDLFPAYLGPTGKNGEELVEIGSSQGVMSTKNPMLLMTECYQVGTYLCTLVIPDCFAQYVALIEQRKENGSLTSVLVYTLFQPRAQRKEMAALKFYVPLHCRYVF